MSVLAGGGRGRNLQQFAIVLFILLGIYILWDNWLPRAPHHHAASIPSQNDGSMKVANTFETGPQDERVPHPEDQALASDYASTCRTLPGADRVMVMLKTGATELYQKLPTHFLTTFTCVPTYMIFSDLAQKFGDVEIHDSIANVSRVFSDHHGDFELYRQQQEYAIQGKDLADLKGGGGWNLDKWKFLPMLHKAFTEAEEGIDWFVVIEADTSLAWANMLRWLKTYDPKRHWYFGAQNVIGSTTFAHGGSGFIISRKAADMLEEARYARGRQRFDEDWEQALSTACCGDEVIARTLDEVRVPLTPTWPIIQGETVNSIDWTDRHWCRPVFTWHHVGAIEIDQMFQFQAQWVEKHGIEKPFLHRDVFEYFIDPHVRKEREGWDNLSHDTKYDAQKLTGKDDEFYEKLEEWERDATKSKEDCIEACMQHKDDCMQWMYSSEGRCYLGRDMRFGRIDDRDKVEERWISGWIVERVDKFKERFEDCEVEWKGVGAEDT